MLLQKLAMLGFLLTGELASSQRRFVMEVACARLGSCLQLSC